MLWVSAGFEWLTAEVVISAGSVLQPQEAATGMLADCSIAGGGGAARRALPLPAALTPPAWSEGKAISLLR